MDAVQLGPSMSTVVNKTVDSGLAGKTTGSAALALGKKKNLLGLNFSKQSAPRGPKVKQLQEGSKELTEDTVTATKTIATAKGHDQTLSDNVLAVRTKRKVSDHDDEDWKETVETLAQHSSKPSKPYKPRGPMSSAVQIKSPTLKADVTSDSDDIQKPSRKRGGKWISKTNGKKPTGVAVREKGKGRSTAKTAEELEDERQLRNQKARDKYAANLEANRKRMQKGSNEAISRQEVDIVTASDPLSDAKGYVQTLSDNAASSLPTPPADTDNDFTKAVEEVIGSDEGAWSDTTIDADWGAYGEYSALNLRLKAKVRANEAERDAEIEAYNQAYRAAQLEDVQILLDQIFAKTTEVTEKHRSPLMSSGPETDIDNDSSSSESTSMSQKDAEYIDDDHISADDDGYDVGFVEEGDESAPSEDEEVELDDEMARRRRPGTFKKRMDQTGRPIMPRLKRSVNKLKYKKPGYNAEEQYSYNKNYWKLHREEILQERKERRKNRTKEERKRDSDYNSDYRNRVLNRWEGDPEGYLNEVKMREAANQEFEKNKARLEAITEEKRASWAENWSISVNAASSISKGLPTEPPYATGIEDPASVMVFGRHSARTNAAQVAQLKAGNLVVLQKFIDDFLPGVPILGTETIAWDGRPGWAPLPWALAGANDNIENFDEDDQNADEDARYCNFLGTRQEGTRVIMVLRGIDGASVDVASWAFLYQRFPKLRFTIGLSCTEQLVRMRAPGLGYFSRTEPFDGKLYAFLPLNTLANTVLGVSEDPRSKWLQNEWRLGVLYRKAISRARNEDEKSRALSQYHDLHTDNRNVLPVVR